MPNAKRPSGPGTPDKIARDRVAEREELEELSDEIQGTADDGGRDPTRAARQAERDAVGDDDKRSGNADREKGSTR